MHIDSTTHEHGASAKVYTYEVDYDVGDEAITWHADVSQGGERCKTLSGLIPLTSPGLSALAEHAVRDEVIKRIDTLDEE